MHELLQFFLEARVAARESERGLSVAESSDQII
jgi:hypothetical protein